MTAHALTSEALIQRSYGYHDGALIWRDLAYLALGAAFLAAVFAVKG
jgi:hypothetical protein